MTETYYQVLGVANSASPGEIRSAYRNLAMVVHPDQGGPAPLFLLVSDAYQVLGDAARRDSYDLFLAEGGADPRDYHRREPEWRDRAERRRARGAGGHREAAGPGLGGEARVPPRPAPDEQVRRERERRESGSRTAAPDGRAAHLRYLVWGAALSLVGFWVVQILWLVIDDDLDGPSDVLDLSWSSWWIVALAAANAVLAALVRAGRSGGRSGANAALAMIVCSALLLLVFLVFGARTDDLGVWPAAIGAAMSTVSASRLRGAS